MMVEEDESITENQEKIEVKGQKIGENLSKMEKK